MVEKSVTYDETLKAEILWALKETMSHLKYLSYLEQKRKKTSEGLELKRKELVIVNLTNLKRNEGIYKLMLTVLLNRQMSLHRKQRILINS